MLFENHIIMIPYYILYLSQMYCAPNELISIYR